MDLIDFKNKGLKYDWKTIYTGVNKNISNRMSFLIMRLN